MIKVIGKSIAHMLETKKNFNRQLEYEKNKAAAEKFLAQPNSCAAVDCCPVCGVANFEVWTEIFGFTYCQCRECSFVFLNPSPVAEALAGFYAEEYEVSIDFVAGQANQEISALRFNNIVKPRFDFVKQFITPQSWLDLGAGDGEMVCGLRHLTAEQMRVVGVETNKQAIAFAKNNYGVDLCHSRLLDYVQQQDLSFDVISLFGLLEHLDPSSLLSVMSCFKEKVPQGSWLAILVPLSSSFSSFLQKANHTLIARHLVPPLHISLWNEDNINLLLQKYGFTVKGVWRYGQDCFEMYYQLKDNLTAVEKDKVLSVLPQLQKLIDEADLCDEMLVMAQKI